jgi:preprotein translocase subunit SecA
VRAVAEAGSWAASLDEAALREAARDLGQRLRREGFADAAVVRAFALVREASGRTLEQRHFDVQLVGGRILLDGMVAEMDTGEGKTLTATLAASAAALAGIPVHVVTVNDYLARRDAEWMRPVYAALGLTVGTIVHGLDPAARRAAYASNVTYCSNKELAFDYLKDRIALGQRGDRAGLQLERLYEKSPRLDRLLLRGLSYAIVDEADSVLVDEARTPLIISGPKAADASGREICRVALSLASEMVEGRDFEIETRSRQVRLLATGHDRINRVSSTLGGVWTRRQWREEFTRQAIAARHLYQDGKQYLIRDGKIQIIDEYTGRAMPDRSWERGLHQMIEVKEDLEMTRQIEPLARISYQRFFRRYVRLAGMTGTAREVAGELWSVYRLATARVPTNRPSRRKRLEDRIYATEDEKWRAVIDRIEAVHREGRPVLVGTRSVRASEHLSMLLGSRGLEHHLLNARQDADEARIIAEAGRQRRITVATNMAGRGTDIRLAPGVAKLGGLHVIATELHEARRIDRQLFGRCGRQGDPGSSEALLSLEDELVSHFGSRYPRTRALRLKMAQRSAERLHRRMRRDLLRTDEQLATALAFSGRSE